MKHTMRVVVDGSRKKLERTLEVRRFGIRENLLRILFGEKRQLAIIFPGQSVEKIDIQEMGDEQSTIQRSS